MYSQTYLYGHRPATGWQPPSNARKYIGTYQFLVLRAPFEHWSLKFQQQASSHCATILTIGLLLAQWPLIDGVTFGTVQVGDRCTK